MTEIYYCMDCGFKATNVICQKCLNKELDEFKQLGAKQELERLQKEIDSWFPFEYYKSHSRIKEIVRERLKELE